MTCQPSKCMSRDCRVCVCVCVWGICFCFFASMCTQGLCVSMRLFVTRGVCVWRERACMCACAQGREPRRYLNGSHFRVCRHFSEAAISTQTHRHTDRQTDWVGGWVGDGAQPACSTQGYVLPEVENWWLSPQQEDAPRGKIAVVFHSRAFLRVMWMS